MRAFLVLGALLLTFGLGIAMMIGGTYNDLNEQDIGVTAVYRDSQVWYDNFWKKVKETAQVADAYKTDFKDVFIASIEGRYEGKDPAVSFIMEKNPSLDASLYTRIQDVIETGRNEFAQTQRTLVDRQRRYETSLRSFPNTLFVGFLGFPREVNGEWRPTSDRDGDGLYTVLDYPTVTSATTKEAFVTGEADEVDVFGRGN